MIREYISPALAFGLPAVLLIFATIIIWLGRKQYRMVPPGGSVFKDIYLVTKDAFKGWYHNKGNSTNKSFWDFATDHHDSQKVEDIQVTFHVLKVFLFLPLFWSLFDQHGSRWVLQAEQMDRDFYFFSVTGDQLPTLNPLFTLSLIPVFQMLIYPFIENRFGIKLKQLTKMAIGMFLTSGCFALSGILQVIIDNSPPQSVHVIAQVKIQLFIIHNFAINCKY